MAALAHTICARFEEHAAVNPDAVAVSADDRVLTYRELNEAANRLARSIEILAPDTLTVVVFTGQSTSSIVAMLGVMKTGKIFVPLDARQPQERMRRLLDDCEPQVLVADRQTWPHAQSLGHDGIPVLNADLIDSILSGSNLERQFDGDTPACLMYTSGSTGAPKGVVQTHRTLLARTVAYTDLLHITHDDRLSMLAPCSVAQGFSSALQALLNGASLHMFDLQGMGIGMVSSWLVAQGITVFVTTSSTFRHFTKTLQPQDEFYSVKAIRLGSEPMTREDVTSFRQHFSSSCRLIASMGSTEAGPVAAYVMTRDSDLPGGVPAGYAVDGASLAILDETGRVQPCGALGEIIVRSRFVASGYWRDPERSAAAFAELPRTGTREYRTGDLGILRADGCLEHHGRRDFRVKIRGFRVELEEIERALAAHRQVAQAAVIARTDSTGDAWLAAYVVARDECPAVDTLRAHLRSTVPEHMVPPSIEIVPALPYTAGGKIDRHALQLLPAASTPPTAQAPTDVVELCVKHLWEDLLERRPIGITTNFFEAGGNSLLAARLSTAIERTFRVKLPLATFLSAATITEQAQLLRKRRLEREWPSLVPIRPAGARLPLFCIHLVEGHVLSYRDLVRHLPDDQPVYGLQSRGLDRVSRINLSFEEMARDYIEEIRQLQPEGPYALCGWSFGGNIAYEMARQLEQDGETVALVALLDSTVQPARRPRGILSRVKSHAVALGQGQVHRAYVARRLKNARELVENAVGRRIVSLRRLGYWVPRALHSVRQANKTARRIYEPKPYRGKLTIFAPTLETGRASYDTRWNEFALGGIDIIQVEGTHHTMVFEPHCRGLAAALAQCLAQACVPPKQPRNPPHIQTRS